MKARILHLSTCLALAGVAQAQSPAPAAAPAEFPPAAQALTGDALRQKLDGRVYAATAANGRAWRLEYTRSGYMFVDVEPTFKDSGPYRVEGSQVCVTMQRTGASCSEYRVEGETVYLKRTSNGEVLTLRPR